MQNQKRETGASEARGNLLSAPFDWRDPFLFEDQLDSEERLIRDQAHRFAQDKLLPRILEAHRHERPDPSVFPEMGEMGFLGAFIDGYDCPGVGAVANGLIMRELERVDTSYRSMANVQGVVMDLIFTFGSEAQCQRFLPDMAAGTKVGAFAMTEPDIGSDPSQMTTRARTVPGGYRLTGTKTWISHAPIADVILVWARNEDGVIRGYLVERGAEGLATPKIEGKCGMRASPTGQVILDDVLVREDMLLPNAVGLRQAFSGLNNARFSICWGVWGAAEYCWHSAVQYALDRKQFGRPIAANQLVQSKLADMQTEIALGLQSCLRVSRLRDEGKASPHMLSLLKRNGAAKAFAIARMARDIHGANGISDEFHIVRHMMNLEVVCTLEGTHDIHALSLGREQTGIQAFTA